MPFIPNPGEAGKVLNNTIPNPGEAGKVLYNTIPNPGEVGKVLYNTVPNPTKSVTSVITSYRYPGMGYTFHTRTRGRSKTSVQHYTEPGGGW